MMYELTNWKACNIFMLDANVVREWGGLVRFPPSSMRMFDCEVSLRFKIIAAVNQQGFPRNQMKFFLLLPGIYSELELRNFVIE